MSLSKLALCLRLTIQQPQMRKKDRRTTHEIQEIKQARHGSGGYYKELYTKEHRMKVEKPSNLLRTTLNFLSHRWDDRGEVIMATETYDQNKLGLAKLKEDVVTAHDWMKENFHVIKEDGMRELGEMANESDYPSEAEFQSKFFVGLEVLPVPIRVSTNHLHALLEQDKDMDRERFRKILEDAEAENLKSVTEQCAKRVYDTTEHIIDAINHKQRPRSQKGKRNTTYHDTIIGHVWDLVQILPQLNLAKSPEIEKLHEALRSQILGQLRLDNVTSASDKQLKTEVAAMKTNLDLENSVKAEAEKILKMAESILPS